MVCGHNHCNFHDDYYVYIHDNTLHIHDCTCYLCIYLQSCKPEPLRKAKVICMTQAGV